jgi:hypothetical protein
MLCRFGVFSADLRAHLGLVGFDDGVESGRIDIAFFGQHGFQRPHAQLHFGEFRTVLVVMVMIVFFRHGNF